MKKKLKNKKEILLAGLGQGYREAYLKQNPHGFKKQTSITKNKKLYSRKTKKGSVNADPFFYCTCTLYPTHKLSTMLTIKSFFG